MEEKKYKNWKLDWKYVEYYDNWQIEYEENWKDWMLLDNKVIHYYENWKIKSEYNYKDWEMDGKQVSYYENWQIEDIDYWENGRRNWRRTFYYENWQIRWDEYYKNWLLHWEKIEYYESWKILEGCIYKDGESLICDRWDENWNINLYDEDWRIKIYFPDGDIEEEYVYKDWEFIQRKVYDYGEDYDMAYEIELWKSKWVITITYYESWNIVNETNCNNAKLEWIESVEDVEKGSYWNEEISCKTTDYYPDWRIGISNTKGWNWKTIIYDKDWKIEHEALFKNRELVKQRYYNENWNLIEEDIWENERLVQKKLYDENWNEIKN